MLEEIKRKAFHMLALLYVAGILMMPRPSFVAGVGLLFGLNLFLEIWRLKTIHGRQFFGTYFGGLFREEEKEKLTGVFWMLLGVLITALLIRSHVLAATIILYVIFGDGIASLAGKKLQGPHWPGSPKRLSGSLACFCMCLLIGAWMQRPVFPWMSVWIGAATATLLEFGFFGLNDNFTIPAGSSLVMLVTNKLSPAFLDWF